MNTGLLLVDIQNDYFPGGSMELLEDDILLITYPVLPNRLYQVEYRTNLLDGEWLPYGSPEYVTTDLYAVMNSTTNEPRAFFRLQALP